MLAEKISVSRPLGVGQAAQNSRVEPRTINNRIRTGKLKASATPVGHFRVWPSDLRKFLEAHNMDINFDFRGEHPKKLLTIDDDEAYAEMIREVLHDKIENRKVTVSQHGYESLIILGEFKPELVVLDLMIPGIDGFKVLELIAGRKTNYPVKVLVLSGNFSTAAIDRLTRSRADSWLRKPVSVAELLRSVLDLLSNEEPGGRGIS